MVLWKVFEYCFFTVWVPEACLEENVSAVGLSVSGVEHRSSELLMRWTSRWKVTHFTPAVLWPCSCFYSHSHFVKGKLDENGWVGLDHEK